MTKLDRNLHEAPLDILLMLDFRAMSPEERGRLSDEFARREAWAAEARDAEARDVDDRSWTVEAHELHHLQIPDLDAFEAFTEDAEDEALFDFSNEAMFEWDNSDDLPF